MTELDILPIPGDPGFNNARRLLSLRAEVLTANGVSNETLKKEQLDPYNKYALNVQDREFRDSHTHKRDEFIGAFKNVGAAKKLVGAVELKPLELDDLRPYMVPLERVALRRRLQPKTSSIGMFALVAEAGDEQTNILTTLLQTAIQMSLSAESVYIGLPQVDPARPVVMSEGFEPKRVGNVYGIPYTLFERQNA